MHARKAKEMPIAEHLKTKRKLKAVPLKRDKSLGSQEQTAMVKFEIHGQELMEKEVRVSGNSGRIYLPPQWIGHKVKIIRID